MDTDPCEHCGTDLAKTVPYIGILFRCRHCRKLLAEPRRGPAYGGATRVLKHKEPDARPSSKLASAQCPACGEAVIVVRPLELGRSLHLEMWTLDNLGELTALTTGRKTFDLCSDGTADLRHAWDITARPAETNWITHCTHVCLKTLGSVQRFRVEGDRVLEDTAAPF